MTLRPFAAPTTPRRWDTGRRAIAAIRGDREFALVDQWERLNETLPAVKAVR